MALKAEELESLVDVRETEEHVVDVFNRRTEQNTKWKARIRTLDNFLAGNWVVQMPDGQERVDRPQIENRVVTTIEDQGKECGQSLPTLTVESHTSTEAAISRALVRQQALAYGWQISGLRAWLQSAFMDCISTGLAAIKTWPDFGTPLAAGRFPKHSLVDPRTILIDPVFRGGTEPQDVIVAKMVKLRQLRRLYPEAEVRLLDAAKKLRSQDVLVIEYYTPEWISEAAIFQSGSSRRAVLLYQEPNLIGRIPISFARRATADGVLRGQCDPMLAPLVSENRIMSLMLTYVDQAIFSPIAAKNVPGTIKFAPEEIIDVGDGDLRRVDPAHIDSGAFHLMAQAQAQSRAAGISPEARAGQVSQSIVSAAGVDSLQGPLVTNIAAYQLQMEVALTRANEIWLAQDRAYCDARKSIRGYERGRLMRVSYTPSEAIAEGEYANLVTYGAGAGLNSVNAEIRLTQRERNGYVSKRYVRTNLDGVDNVQDLENEILDEAELNALVQGVLAQASQGNLEPLARLHEARKGSESPLAVLPEILAAASPGVEMSPPSSPPGAAAPGAEMLALQKGAIPGGDNTLGPPVLPPLSQLML